MVTRAAMQEIANRVAMQREFLTTEEATKHALVLPFLQALGYDVFDATEVVPEFVADYGIRSGERVDYAIMRDGAPVMLVECKKVGDSLDVARASQLARYFAMTQARIGVLTDGVIYQFFSDLDADNTMDSTPFLRVDVTNTSDRDLEALGNFTRDAFNLDDARSAAASMRDLAAIKGYLATAYEQPDENLVRYVARQVQPGSLSRGRLEYFTDLTRLAFHEFVNDLMNDMLRRASDIVNSEDPATPDPAEPEHDEEDPDETPPKAIETTVEELQAYELVRSLVSDVIDSDRIVMRDGAKYCSVAVDAIGYVICRLRFNVPKYRRVGIVGSERTSSGARKETIYRLPEVNDITKYAEELREAARVCVALASGDRTG